jgi:hypothetical protein
MTTDNSGPYLTAALICEKILREKDEVISIIRIIDRITVTLRGALPPETPSPPIIVNCNAFIALKSGSAIGNRTLKWTLETPSGTKTPEQLIPILLEGEDRGVNLVLNLNIQVEQEGLHWFTLFLEDQFLTRIPLRIFYQWIS